MQSTELYRNNLLCQRIQIVCFPCVLPSVSVPPPPPPTIVLTAIRSSHLQNSEMIFQHPSDTSFTSLSWMQSTVQTLKLTSKVNFSVKESSVEILWHIWIPFRVLLVKQSSYFCRFHQTNKESIISLQHSTSEYGPTVMQTVRKCYVFVAFTSVCHEQWVSFWRYCGGSC